MSMLNNVVGYWAYIGGGGLYSGGLIFGGGAYIWNEVSISTCCGLIFGGWGLYLEVYLIGPNEEQLRKMQL